MSVSIRPLTMLFCKTSAEKHLPRKGLRLRRALITNLLRRFFESRGPCALPVLVRRLLAGIAAASDEDRPLRPRGRLARFLLAQIHAPAHRVSGVGETAVYRAIG